MRWLRDGDYDLDSALRDGMSDREYPKLPAVAEVPTQKMDPAILRDMIAKTIFSISSDETRQHLAGVLFECDGKVARIQYYTSHDEALKAVGLEE